MNDKKKTIYLIGAGKVGSALIFKLIETRYDVKYVTDRKIKNKKNILAALKKNGIEYSDKIECNFIKEVDVIFISVQDAYLEKVIDDIKKLNVSLKKKILIHCSGSLTSEIFKESTVINNRASFHPIQTFNTVSKSGMLLENIFFGIEGGKNALDYLKKMSKSFNSNSLIIKPEKKYLYHIASVLSSNFLVTLLFAVSKIVKEMGYKEEQTFSIYEPIIKNTLCNIKKDGITKSLTGPFDRNDVKIIDKHIKELDGIKLLASLYANFGMLAAELAEQKGSISNKEKIKLESLMKKNLRS
jgi:predicted short-subunit dehydrogenase-like oxidoreductase (DUF2520 family)